QCEPNEISIDGDNAVGRNRASVALSALAADGIAAEGTYSSNKRTYSYGAHAAHVAVDPGTGHVALVDYMAVEDVGRIINPLTLHGQTVGAIVQGLGGALLEDLAYDENGQFLAGSLADYLLPTASDFPVIRAHALEEKPAPGNPLGAQGAGEGGIIPVGGVIANASGAKAVTASNPPFSQCVLVSKGLPQQNCLLCLTPARGSGINENKAGTFLRYFHGLAFAQARASSTDAGGHRPESRAAVC